MARQSLNIAFAWLLLSMRVSGSMSGEGITREAAVATEEIAMMQVAGAIHHQMEHREITKHKHDDVNETELMNQLGGAVHIEELQRKINETVDTEKVKQLKSQLTDLQKKFPSSEKVREHLQGQWQNVTQAVNLQDAKDKLQDAKNAGCDKI